jgi:hypothetical protein
MKDRESLAERLNTAAKAKKALLDKAQAKAKTINGPKRSAERLAIATARDGRIADRKAAKEAEQIRLDAARKAEELARQAEVAATAAREADLAASQKRARDAKYAARKARRK